MPLNDHLRNYNESKQDFLTQRSLYWASSNEKRWDDSRKYLDLTRRGICQMENAVNFIWEGYGRKECPQITDMIDELNSFRVWKDEQHDKYPTLFPR